MTLIVVTILTAATILTPVSILTAATILTAASILTPAPILTAATILTAAAILTPATILTAATILTPASILNTASVLIATYNLHRVRYTCVFSPTDRARDQIEYSCLHLRYRLSEGSSRAHFWACWNSPLAYPSRHIISSLFIMSAPNHSEAGLAPEEMPTIQEVESWNKDQLLKWIQQTAPDLFELEEDVQKFRAARIKGPTFLEYAKDIGFFRETNLPLGVYRDLASLARKLVEQSNIRLWI